MPPKAPPKMLKLREPEERDCVFLEKIMLSMNTHYNSQKADELREFLLNFRNSHGLPYGMEARHRFVKELYVELEVGRFFKFTKEDKDFRIFLTTEMMHLLTVQLGPGDGSEVGNREEEVETIYHSGPSSTQINAARRLQAAPRVHFESNVQVDRANQGNSRRRERKDSVIPPKDGSEVAGAGEVKRRRAPEDSNIPTKGGSEVAGTGEAKRRRGSLGPLHALKSSLNDTVYGEKASALPRSARRVKVAVEQSARRPGGRTESQNAAKKIPQLRPTSRSSTTMMKKSKSVKSASRTPANKKPAPALDSSAANLDSPADCIFISSPDVGNASSSSLSEPNVVASTEVHVAQPSVSLNNGPTPMETSTVSTEPAHQPAPQQATTEPHLAPTAGTSTLNAQISQPAALKAQVPHPTTTVRITAKTPASEAEKTAEWLERIANHEAYLKGKEATNEATTTGWLDELPPQTQQGRVTMGKDFDDALSALSKNAQKK